MSIVNNSIVPAELVLDMRTYEENPDAPDGIQYLTITEIKDD